jgi:NAD(P)H-dependent FMN reductase
LISGSTRAASTNTAALRTAVAIAPDEVTAVLYDGLRELPAFVPDDPGTPAVAALREAIAGADAVLFCTPEYAGTLPGSLKNLIDWTVGSGELYEKTVAWLTVAQPGRGEGAVATLRTVLGYVNADIIEDACVRAPVGRETVGDDGLVHDQQVGAAILRVLGTLAERSKAL